jgi:hypothetical protein
MPADDRLRRYRRVLLGVALAIALVDLVWLALVPFDVDAPAYGFLGVVSLTLFLGSWFYDRVRHDDGLVAMLFGAGFLVAFSAAFSTLNYFLLTVAGTRIDATLAALDLTLGFDWPAVMAFAADRPFATAILKLSYNAILPQIALVLVALAFFGQWRKIYAFCAAYALSAIVTVSFWAFFPSFGAFASYELPADIAARLNLAVDSAYVESIIGLLATGPGLITPGELKGLIAFPSFHSVLAVLIAWYARDLRFVAMPVIVLNVAVLIATPIHGGHYGIDVVAGIVVAFAMIAVVSRIFSGATVADERAVPVLAALGEVPAPGLAGQPSGRQSIGTWPGRDATRATQARMPG